MPITVSLLKKLEEVEPQLRGVLVAILEEIERQRAEPVTKLEFNELKEIVRDLAEAQRELTGAQKGTERGLHELRGIVQELAEAQKKTEQALIDLSGAQKKTEEKLQNLVNEHSKTREQLGGLSNTVGYVL